MVLFQKIYSCTFKIENRFLINGTSCQNIKFQVFMLHKKCIFIAFFRQSPTTALCGILNFTDQALTLKQIRI